MTTPIIIACISFVLIVGFVKLFIRYRRIQDNFEFAHEYRNKFVEFSNKYFEKRSQWQWVQSEGFDGELYMWLTKNISKIQTTVGSFGIMDYIAPFQTFKVSNYQIIINTIPKFRDGNIQEKEVNSIDDCLIRYLGYTEDMGKSSQKNLKNPIVWFRVGFHEIISLPLFVLNWFGIFSGRTIDKVMDSVIYKVFTGIIALVAFASSIVTIIQGKEQTLEFINRLLGK